MDGIDSEKALESIKRYNEYAKNGLDESTTSTPSTSSDRDCPFYATKSVAPRS